MSSSGFLENSVFETFSSNITSLKIRIDLLKCHMAELVAHLLFSARGQCKGQLLERTKALMDLLNQSCQ